MDKPQLKLFKFLIYGFDIVINNIVKLSGDSWSLKNY